MKTPWPETPLGDVLTERRESPNEEAVLSGRQPIIKKIRFADGGMEFRASGESKTNLISIHPGDLVLSGINAAKGAIALYEPADRSKAAATIHYSSYSMDRERVEPRFLWLLLRHGVFRERLERFVPNGIKTELKASKFLPIPIPLPPLPEQRRIVAKIDRIASRVEEAKRLRFQTETCRGILQDAISVGGRYADITYEPLRNLLTTRGLQNGKSVKSRPDGEFECLTLSAITEGRIDFTQSKPVPMPYKDAGKYLVSENDVFIVRGNGSKHLVGRAAVAVDTPANVIFPDLLIRIDLSGTILTPAFFVAMWNASEVRAQIEQQAKTTAGIWKINQQHILSTTVPLLSHEQQHDFLQFSAAHHRMVQEMKEAQSHTLFSLEALMPALLDQAFRGEI